MGKKMKGVKGILINAENVAKWFSYLFQKKIYFFF